MGAVAAELNERPSTFPWENEMTFEIPNAVSANSEPQGSLTAFFDTRAEAEQAAEAVKAAGVAAGDVQIVEGGSDESTLPTRPYHKEGFWASLMSLFVPDDDRYTYAEGLRRGGYLVTVQHVAPGDETLREILAQHGAVDLPERATGWRADGWQGSEAKFADEDAGTQFDLPNAGQREPLAGAPPLSQAARDKVAERDISGSAAYRDVTSRRDGVFAVQDTTPLASDTIADRDISGSAAYRDVAGSSAPDRAFDAGERGEKTVTTPELQIPEDEILDEVDTFRAQKIEEGIRLADLATDEERAAGIRAKAADASVKRAG